MARTTLNKNSARQATDRKRALRYLRVSTPSQVKTDFNPEVSPFPRSG
jgi:hypothetical protein